MVKPSLEKKSLEELRQEINDKREDVEFSSLALFMCSTLAEFVEVIQKLENRISDLETEIIHLIDKLFKKE